MFILFVVLKINPFTCVKAEKNHEPFYISEIY